MFATRVHFTSNMYKNSPVVKRCVALMTFGVSSSRLSAEPPSISPLNTELRDCLFVRKHNKFLHGEIIVCK